MARKHETKLKSKQNTFFPKDKIKSSATMQFFEKKTKKITKQMKQFFRWKSDKKKE